MPSTDRLRISLAQLNPTVGDIAGNVAKLQAALATARGQGADLLVTSELFLAGYPAEDLVLRADFLDAIERAVEQLKLETASGTALLVGAPWRHEGKVHNAALLLDRGELRAVRFKHHLPNYGVFDEARTFAAGPAPGPIAFRGVRLGVMIAQDMATPDVAETLEESGAQMLVVLNGSPFEADKQDERIQQAVQRVQESGLALLAVNQIGGQDELVFDGASFALDRSVRLRVQAPSWQEAIVPTEWALGDDERWAVEPGPMTAPQEGPAALYHAVMLGLRDFVTKNGFQSVAVDLFSDWPSALVEAIAVDALGSARVSGLDDADEDGLIELSALDKSDLALGRGDLGGDYAVLRDIYRTTAIELARWRNRNKPAGALGPDTATVPERMLKAAAEEPALDEILTCLIERNMTVNAIVARGHALETVMRVWRMLDRAEYKRRQAPPGVKTTRRAFGRDRRYPITNSFQGG
jgi:predicted amidohydrolase/NH3-dependent NAD+ synthetase